MEVNWIKVEDRLPEPLSKDIPYSRNVWFCYGKIVKMGYCIPNLSRWFGIGPNTHWTIPVTHWAEYETPAPPKE